MWTRDSVSAFNKLVHNEAEVFSPKSNCVGESGMVNSKRLIVDCNVVIKSSHNPGVPAFGKGGGKMPSNIESSTYVTDGTSAMECAVALLRSE
ncbi:hypothetical protein PC116_g26175 [Phytophthora cactorum]|uniref:Uncharacterized protein n=1 Tax=Phytophthora cactorum TaxID=29920 RepID=A0A8T1F3T1_9STRA|nr:hypothetical protein PC112_g22612 [Phytophthora cactorum]KAG2798782.1 hypothetical protein PC111_g20702 [Phytophthora cactorum]KAG2874625.1 hypothetical protein PC114_g25168 [Phytophthora cactorum]KAG2894783.1 hypothetical protein PC117_g23396 [Phytophthora cactorum]KAG2961764.1 hypothetical protein PC118_g21793 [Phytophthora cactorum]